MVPGLGRSLLAKPQLRLLWLPGRPRFPALACYCGAVPPQRQLHIQHLLSPPGMAEPGEGAVLGPRQPRSCTPSLAAGCEPGQGQPPTSPSIYYGSAGVNYSCSAAVPGQKAAGSGLLWPRKDLARGLCCSEPGDAAQVGLTAWVPLQGLVLSAWAQCRGRGRCG